MRRKQAAPKPPALPSEFQAWVATRWNRGVMPPPNIARFYTPEQMKDCPEPWRSLFVATAGFAGESGEVVEHVKKLVRDGTFDRRKFVEELFDQKFYHAMLMNLFDISESEVVAAGKRKLAHKP